MRDAFSIVRQGYDAIGATYREWSSAGAVRQEWLGRLLERLRPGSVVLELGCGSGEPATRCIAECHRVIGVDASAVQLGLARQAAPSALLVQANMTRFAVKPGTVDAVASFYALGHVPSDSHAPLFAAITSWLRPGGVLVTSAPVGAGDEVVPNWLGTEMFFGGIGVEATRQAVSDAGLRLEVLQTVDEDEGAGNIVHFNWLIASKPSTQRLP